MKLEVCYKGLTSKGARQKALTHILSIQVPQKSSTNQISLDLSKASKLEDIFTDFYKPTFVVQTARERLENEKVLIFKQVIQETSDSITQ